MGTGERRLPTFVKYLLLETPGWVLAALVALLLYERVGLSAPLIVTLLAVWVAKDLVLYPLLKDALSGDAGSEADKLLGQDGVVETTLDPVGIVRQSEGGAFIQRNGAAPRNRQRATPPVVG